METMTIGQVAERTGFTTSSLRYYEGIGLVAPAGRTAAGYRFYDESTVARLGFIARAKQLGCTLEEVTELVGVWQGDQCGPVQRRLHDLVTAKVSATQERLEELTAFAGQLRTAAAQLSADPVDGPCDDGCACITADPGSAVSPVPITLGPKPVDDDVPVACTLTAAGMEERTAEWAAVLAHVAHRAPTGDGGLRLTFDPTTPVDELLRLVAAEQGCCAFFAFTISLDAAGIAIEVRAPEAGRPMIATVFGDRP